MATQTVYTYIGGTGLTSPSRNYDITAKAVRATESNTSVTVTVTVTEGFGANANPGLSTNENTSRTALKVSFKSTMNGSTEEGVLNKNGTMWYYPEKVSAVQMNSNGSSYKARKPFKSASTEHKYNNWVSGTKKLTVKLYHNGSQEGDTITLDVKMPTYSSSSGGGTSTTYADCSVTSFSVSNTKPTPGEWVTFTCEGKSGTNSQLAGFFVTTTQGSTSGMDYALSSPVAAGGGTGSTKWSIYAPKTAGTYTYYAYASDGSKESSTYKRVSITVTEVKPTIESASGGSVPNTGGSVYVTTSTSTGKFAYCVGSPSGTKTNVNSSSTYVFVSGATTIYCWAYNPDNSSTNAYSASYVKATVTSYVPTTISSITITPTILKENGNTIPDLVKVIQGQASVSGATLYTWQYRRSSTSGGFSNSWMDLGVASSPSFSSVDMSEKLSPGDYFQLRLFVTGANDADISDPSEVYQLPAKPGTATITKVIPKANPENGYTENTQDGKIYYGSGVFLTWDNPTEGYTRMPIRSVELAYQQRKAGATEWESTKLAQFKYYNLDGTAYSKDNYTVSAASCGGGADLEVESLYETKVGIKITDTIGQTSETYYSTSYYKAESPTFGGNIQRNHNSFRPFTCNENEYLDFSSSLARASSQDELFYYIDCYVPDRRETIELIEGIPVSTSIFSTNYIPNQIIYPEGATGTEGEDIYIYMKSAAEVGYKVRSGYFKSKLLSNKALRSPANNAAAVYNDDFSDVIYKASVRDSFDSRSTVYNSEPITINYIEAPVLGGRNTDGLQIGVNRYVKSANPFDDNSVVVITSSSESNDRMVNPGESIVFAFRRAKDYNAADYLSEVLGDVTDYNVYVSRQDTIPESSYKDLNYTLLKTYSIDELKKKKPNDSNNDYYYLEYPITSYQDSKFITFRLEAVDSKNNVSDSIYSTSYVVPCRAQGMDYRISTVKLYDSVGTFYPSFKLKVDDLGGATFVNSSYSYNTYPNFERVYSISPTSDSTISFKRKCQILLEGCLDGNFDNHGTTVVSKKKSLVETVDDNEKTVQNWFSVISNPISDTNGNYDSGILEEYIFFTDAFPDDWTIGEKPNQKLNTEYITKIFFRVTTIIAYGLNDIELNDAIDSGRYLITNSVTAPYSFYDDAPTVSYRNHQVGINTKDFSIDNENGQQEVLIIQDNGSYNLVVFKGAEQKIILNLTERRFYTVDKDENLVNEVDFGNGAINGMTIDGGSW